MTSATAPDVSARSVGIITADPSSTLLALCANAELGFVVLDAEQTPLTVGQCADAAQRLGGTGVRVSIRVPDIAPDTLVAFANTGADELVLPHLRHPQELEAASAAIRYAPSGQRSRQVSPASRFGSDYSRVPALSVLFETVEAVEHAAAFAASSALGSGWVGPTDLAADLARHGRTGPGELEKATQTVIDTLRDAGRSIGVPAPSMLRVDEAFARGANLAAVYWERELASLLSGFTTVASA